MFLAQQVGYGTETEANAAAHGGALGAHSADRMIAPLSRILTDMSLDRALPGWGLNRESRHALRPLLTRH